MRTLGTIALVALAGFVAIKIVFGFAGGIIGLLLGLCWFALKILLVAGIVYWLLTVFSPDTAKKIRESMKSSV
jgi:ABC-type transport system involved in multi-copper enzyme maturation permease subunit